MKRTTKRYVVTTSALNSYGYRVLTEGVDLAQFIKNPLLLWMHKKDLSPGPYDKTIPLGRAVDIQKNGDQITCALEFSESNPFAMMIYGMYEDNTLNMLSLGANPVTWSDAPQYLVEGQTGPTFTKCKAIEFSCCDVGSNDDALTCQLYDNNDNAIQLASITGEGMKRLFNAARPKTATPGNGNITPLDHSHSTLIAVQNAVKAGKFTDVEASKLLATGSDKNAVKDIITKVKQAKIDPKKWDGKIHESLMPLLNKSWGEMDSSFGDGIRLLKEHVPEVYRAKFFEKHDRLPAERDGKPL